MTRRVHVIVNPASGFERPVLRILNTALYQAGVEWEMKITRRPGDAARLAGEAVAEGVKVVAVYGGDGTISEVAGGVAGSGVPLAILPGGTGNLLAHELGVPIRLPRAVALLAEGAGTIRTVDIGRINGRAFMVGIATGIFAEMIQRADSETKARIGFLAYHLSGLQAAVESKVSRYRIVMDGQEIESEGVSCLICNCVNFGVLGLTMHPTVDLNDGYLDVIVVRRVDLPTILAVAGGALNPAEGIQQPLQHWRARDVMLEVDPVQPITYDGEMIEAQPIRAIIEAGALKLIVPR